MEVGDIVLVMPSIGENVAIPISTPEVGDVVFLYPLENEAKIAVPSLTLEVGSYVFNSPSFNFAGFNWSLDFSFNLIPLIFDLLNWLRYEWSWSGWGYVNNAHNANDYRDTQTSPGSPVVSFPTDPLGEPVNSIGLFGWNSFATGENNIAYIERTFYFSHQVDAISLQVFMAWEESPISTMKMWVDGNLTHETQTMSAWVYWMAEFTPRSSVTIKLARDDPKSFHGIHYLAVGNLYARPA